METLEIIPTSTETNCADHQIKLIKCSAEDCTDNLVCKLCALESKYGIEHLNNHYEFLKDGLSKSKKEDEIEAKNLIKNEELYADLNKAYLEYIQNVDHDLNSLFSKLNEKKIKVSEQVKSSLIEQYLKITEDFEQVVRSVSEKVDSLSTSDKKVKNDVKKLRKDLDDKLNFISNPQLFNKDFDQIISKSNRKLIQMKLEDIMDEKFNFRMNFSMNLLWETGESEFKVTSKGSSYWCIRSQEVVDGPFTCKVLIKYINSSNVNNYWNYTFGIIRELSTNSDSSYYNDAVLLQSNGYLPTQFTGSGSGTGTSVGLWKTGDILLMKRDEYGNIFFGLNTEDNYKEAFKNITGRFKICMGFSSSMSEDQFEMIELMKF